MKELKKKIKNRKANIAVIGMGYVGLPVACLLAKAGFKVTGINRGTEKVDLINKGISPLDTVEEGVGELVKSAVKRHGLIATTDYDVAKEADIFIIAVETPIDKRTHQPIYEALKSALTSIGDNLKKGSLVIVESTIAPGTTDNLVVPTLEKSSGMVVNKDFFVGHCPERVKANRLLYQLKNYPRVLGGLTKETGEVMVRLYKTIINADLDITNPLTAEVVKTEENTFSDTLIAQANALALLSQSYGVNAYDVTRLIRKIPGHWASYLNPGPGVGGHCIPKDPYLKISQLQSSSANGRSDKLVSQLVNLVREINDYMPQNMIHLLKKSLSEANVKRDKAKIVVFGYSYKENTDDFRNSPTEVLVNSLSGKVKEIKIHDPHVKKFSTDMIKVLKGADALLLMVGHDKYKNLKLKQVKVLMNSPIIVDGRNFFSKQEAENLGFIYKGVGNA